MEADNTEEEMPFCQPPHLYVPEYISTTKPAETSEPKDTLIGSKLHCDHALWDDEQDLYSTTGSYCLSVACNIEIGSRSPSFTSTGNISETLHPGSSSLLSADSDCTQTGSDLDNVNPGQAPKRRRKSLSCEFSRLTLSQRQQDNSLTSTSTECQTLVPGSNTEQQCQLMPSENLSTNYGLNILTHQYESKPLYVKSQSQSTAKDLAQTGWCHTGWCQGSHADSDGLPLWHMMNLDVITPEMTTMQDDNGDTVLHYAIINEDRPLVNRILGVLPHHLVLDIDNNIKQTPLHLAVITHQPDVIRRLLRHGADIEIRDRNGDTALHLACKRACLDCVIQLTRPLRGDEMPTTAPNYHVPFRRIPQDRTLMNYDGQTCVHVAASSRSLAILDHLLKPEVGHGINIRHGRTGRTVLHEAVCNRDLTLIRHLLEMRLYFGLDIDCQAFDGSTPLQMALCNGYREAAVLLKEYGAKEDDVD